MATATVTILDAQREYRRGQIYVALAALAWSTAGVLQRGLQVDTATQVALRAAFACVTIFAYVAVTERGRVVAACRSVGVAGIGFAVAVACASGSFIVALNHTTVAHVLFIQAMAPVLAALLAWLLLGEPITTRTAVAMGVALVGVGVMIGGPGGGSVVGDGLVAADGVLVRGRDRDQPPSPRRVDGAGDRARAGVPRRASSSRSPTCTPCPATTCSRSPRSAWARSGSGSCS